MSEIKSADARLSAAWAPWSRDRRGVEAGQRPDAAPRRAARRDPRCRLSPRGAARRAGQHARVSRTRPRRSWPPATFALIAGGDRAMFDRITLRPRMLVPTIDMDLSRTILGETHFVPIIVGPVSDQKRFHPDGELATAKGAAAAKAFMIVSSRSSVPLDQIAAAEEELLVSGVRVRCAAKTQIADGVKAGAKAIVITVGAVARAPAPSRRPRLPSIGRRSMR